MKNFTKGVILFVVLAFSNLLSAHNSDIIANSKQLKNNCSCTLNVTISPNDTVCTGSCTGVLSATAFGGSPPYTYNWSNGCTLNTNTGLCAGTYTITMMDAAACTATASASVTIESPIPSFTITPTVTNATCIGIYDGSISLATGGPTAPFRYEWGNIYGSNSYNNLNIGTYTVTVRDVNNSCNVYTYNVSNNNTCNYITGKTFNDSNFNCAYNAGEPGLSSSFITITPGSYVVYPNSSGNYSQYVPYGNYTVTQTMLLGNPFGACSFSQNVTVEASTPAVNFADTTHTALQDPMISYLYATPPIIGDSCNASFQVKNNGTVFSNGSAYFVLPDSMSFVSASPAFTMLSHDTLYWNYTNLLPGDTLNFTIRCVVDTNPNLFNYSTCQSAGVIPVGFETNTQNDIMEWCEPFLVACDPNNKAVSPPGQGPNGYIHLTDSLLTYIIRFENTGTAPAMNIYVVDTISNYLDINTFRVLGASHNYSYTQTGNRIRFTFSNINLPDTTANKKASQGWIEYQVKQKNTNAPGDIINNKAYIYFDYNAPVITGTTVNTIQSPLSVPNTNKQNNFLLYPNPSSDLVNLSYTLNLPTDVKVQILDFLGRTVLLKDFGTKPAGEQKQNISVAALAEGTYIVKLQTGDFITNKKLVIIK